jgi:hypothetical protein
VLPDDSQMHVAATVCQETQNSLQTQQKQLFIKGSEQNIIKPLKVELMKRPLFY